METKLPLMCDICGDLIGYSAYELEHREAKYFLLGYTKPIRMILMCSLCQSKHLEFEEEE